MPDQREPVVTDSTDTVRAGRFRRPALSHGTMRWMIAGLLALCLVYAFRIASTFVLPVVISCVMALLLAPPMRWLMRRGLVSGLARGRVAGLARSPVAGLVAGRFSSSGWAWPVSAPRTRGGAGRRGR